MMMKKLISLLLALSLLALLPCLAAAEEPVSVTGQVTAVEKYGHALLDVSIEDFLAAGFSLGDVVTVTAGTYEGDMPFFNGYYVENGGYMVRAYPGHEFIAVCINYGKFAETAGIDVGDPVTITLKTPGGALTVQEINSLTYTNDPADYASDEVFANWRAITLGAIGEGRLYRSCSPVDNQYNRAAVANALAEAAGIRTVLNLADTAEELQAHTEEEGFASDYYMSLDILPLGMPINFTSEEFGNYIAQGLTFMASGEAPYLVHCTEGKDRAGFTAMVLEALMGATLEEIEADYMLSYVNYYHIDPEADAEKYVMLMEKNIVPMVQALAGEGADLAAVDLAAAAESYLLAHGMTAEATKPQVAKIVYSALGKRGR